MQWSPNLCRICGSLKVCQSISTELKDKIKRYLNLNIGKYLEDTVEKICIFQITYYFLAIGTEYKPQHMCLKCIGKLVKFANFIDLSHKNDLKFDSLYRSCVEVSKKDKFGKSNSFLVKSHKSANEILESRGNYRRFLNKFQFDCQRKRLSSSLQRSQKPGSRRHYSLVKRQNLEGENELKCFPKKSNLKMVMKLGSKQREKSSTKADRVKHHKKKYNRYLDLSRKYLKVKSHYKKKSHKSPKLLKKVM